MIATFDNGAKPLKGRVALVTGAARGIGRAIAYTLACRGAAVAVNYRSSQAQAEELSQLIGNQEGQCLLVQGDVANSEEAQTVVRRVLDEYKRLDILVNNAGITRDRSLRKMADDDWGDVINVNLNGVYYCTRAAFPVMVEQKYGRIINISSSSGSAIAGQANYAASKGGVVAFTKVVALEGAKFNITANCVSPGFTYTEMLAQVPDCMMEQIKSKIPLGRVAMPEEIGKAVAFLAAEADYITGQNLGIDGGLYM